MTRHSGDTERRLGLNPNAQNVFFMSLESIVIWGFLFVAGMSRVRVNEIREDGRRGKRMDELVDGWMMGKINEQPIKRRNFLELKEDKVDDGC